MNRFKQISLSVLAWLVLQIGRGFILAGNAAGRLSDWLYAKVI